MDLKKIKYLSILLLCVFIVGIILFIIFNNINNENSDINDSSNNVAKLAAESNILGNSEQLDNVNNRIENVLSQDNSKPIIEEDLASYSTKLGSSSENRLTNIRITCEKLNGTVVAVGDTFSFCGLSGKPTSEEGYKEASTFLNGKTVQSIGGRKLPS